MARLLVARRFRSGAWIPLAAAAGAVGTLVNTAAIRLVSCTGVPPGAGGLSKLVLAGANGFLALTGSTIRAPDHFGLLGQETFHAAMGVLMAIVYAWLFESRLPGSSWLRGLLFCQLPWLAQAFAVLPLTGSGVCGLRLSPLTPLASWLVNAIYGVTLGWMYGRISRPWTKEADAPTING